MKLILVFSKLFIYGYTNLPLKILLNSDDIFNVTINKKPYGINVCFHFIFIAIEWTFFCRLMAKGEKHTKSFGHRGLSRIASI